MIIILILVALIGCNSVGYAWEWPWTSYSTIYNGMSDKEKETLFNKEVKNASLNSSLRQLEIEEL